MIEVQESKTPFYSFYGNLTWIIFTLSFNGYICIVNLTNQKKTNMTITANNTLAETAANDFRSAVVFNKYGLDFCCGGKKTIEEACNKKGLDSSVVVDEINKTISNGSNTVHFNNWSADFLVDYIVNNHHMYVKQVMPVILKHAEKASKVHCESHPEFKEIFETFREVSEEMNAHMNKEERVLFPFIKNLSKGNEYITPPFGSVNNPIAAMEHEHKDAGDAMAKIRELSSNYHLSDDFCETCRVLYKELNNFEQDLHVHVYLENSILFPMAVELEKKLMSENTTCSVGDNFQCSLS